MPLYFSGLGGLTKQHSTNKPTKSPTTLQAAFPLRVQHVGWRCLRVLHRGPQTQGQGGPFAEPAEGHCPTEASGFLLGRAITSPSASGSPHLRLLARTGHHVAESSGQRAPVTVTAQGSRQRSESPGTLCSSRHAWKMG